MIIINCKIYKNIFILIFMRVAMYYNNNDVRLEELPKPVIAEGELLVKAMACGICGSDVLEWYRIKKAPLVLGHEMTGIIEESKNEKYKVGNRVFVSHHVPCDSCFYCNNDHHTACETLHKTNFYPGGFSEYVRVPEINTCNGIFFLPDNVSYEDGTFIEPLGTVIRGQRLAKIKQGDTVLVLGSGIVGILHIQLAKLKGARVIATDVNEYRIKMAERFGADLAINAENLNEKLVKNKLADKVIVCTGAESAAKQALLSVDKGGTVMFFAVPIADISIPINDFWKNEITIMTSYAAGPRDLKEALELIRDNKINVKAMVTHRLGLEETGLGFRLVADAKDSIKVIIEPHR
jgi:L-iditol 2-dehydrogenase